MIAFPHCGRPRSVWREEAAAETETQSELQLPKDFFSEMLHKTLEGECKNRLTTFRN